MTDGTALLLGLVVVALALGMACFGVDLWPLRGLAGVGCLSVGC